MAMSRGVVVKGRLLVGRITAGHASRLEGAVWNLFHVVTIAIAAIWSALA